MATASVFKPLSMADGRLTSVPTTKSCHHFLSVSPKPTSTPLHLSISLKRNLRLAPLVSRTGVREDEPLKWEEGEGQVEAGLSDWEGEDGVEGGLVTPGVNKGARGFLEEMETSTEPSEEAKLFVGNLPFDMDSEKLAQMFDKAGIVEIAEVIYNRETDQSRGFGFVTMSTVDEAEKAVEMFHRYDVNGRLLTVNKASPRGGRPQRSEEFGRPQRSQDFESSFQMYVGNLPWQVDDARLEQVFSEHGKVVDARVVYDRETGRSRGFGFVKMATKTEVDDAIAALDGQSLDGRAIRVNVAEERPRRAFV